MKPTVTPEELHPQSSEVNKVMVADTTFFCFVNYVQGKAKNLTTFVMLFQR